MNPTFARGPQLMVRKLLDGPTSWVSILAASIVVPILAVTVLFVHDIQRLSAAAGAERAGIAYLTALQRLVRDASASRANASCEPTANSAGFGRTIDADIARVDRLEHQTAFMGPSWGAAVARWHGAGPAVRRADALVSTLVPQFIIIADRSGVTYDPQVAGIDLADALAYRLPRATERFRQLHIALCPRTRLRPFELARLTGAAVLLVDDARSDIAEAIVLDRTLPAQIASNERRVIDATRTAFGRIDAFEQTPSRPAETAARAAATRGSRAIDTLIDALAPALDQIVLRRLDGFRQRFYLTLLPGILAMVAAALFVLLGARSVLQRAELARMKRTAAELAHHATHDALTGLPNRAAFVTALEDAIARGRQLDGAVTVLFIDLDHFKLVNDSLGHAAGDVVLCTIAERLQAICERFAASIIARFGGDEFAMLLADRDPAALTERVDAVVARIEGDLRLAVSLGPANEQQQIVVSASVGIASLDRTAQCESLAADLLRDADVAMYEAKSRGRSRAATFGPSMRERAVHKLRLTTDLHVAAERGEFFLARDPVVRLRDGVGLGCEALIRWDHPQLGVLAPGAFLPIAEESGAIVGIGRWVLGDAFATIGSLAGFIHVNLAVQDLTQDALVPTIAMLLERHAVDPRRFAIEITEGSIVRSGDDAEAMLVRLRSLGVRIWIDDFGIEYSSLRYLDRLPVDGVKIDRSFVSGADGKLASPSIVRTILDLARSYHLDVIAEGVETQAQRDALLALGCPLGQGYLYSQPPTAARSAGARSGDRQRPIARANR